MAASLLRTFSVLCFLITVLCLLITVLCLSSSTFPTGCPVAKPQDILDHDSLDRVSNLRLLARTVVESFISGQHRSVYKGYSVEFAQHRQYARGDEMRHIDWKVFGKSDRLVVKQYEEETNLRATICLDCSGSMGYGSGKETKLDFGRKAAAALAYLMIGQSDASGLITFDTEIRSQVPPRAAISHLSAILEELVNVKAGAETNLGTVMHRLCAQLKRRGLVILISDLFGPMDELVQALAHLHHKRHEVILFQVLDPAEFTFPFDTMAEFKSLEKSDHRVKLDAPRVRKAYLERFERFMRRLKEVCHQFRFDHVVLSTDQPFDGALSRYLKHRQGK